MSTPADPMLPEPARHDERSTPAGAARSVSAQPDHQSIPADPAHPESPRRDRQSAPADPPCPEPESAPAPARHEPPQHEPARHEPARHESRSAPPRAVRPNETRASNDEWTPRQQRTRLRWEVVLVLAATLGQSALYSLITLLRRYLSSTPLSEQSAQLNPTRDAEAVWNFVAGVLDVAFDLVLVALVVYLLWEPGRNALRAIGLDFTRFGSDVARAGVIGLVIGVPGLGLYLLGRALGWFVSVQTAPEGIAWWTAIVLLLSALRAGLQEEVIMLGWFFDRFRRLGVGPIATIVTSAAIRGLYHAYQGPGAILGNFVMGLLFGWAYQRWGRVMPLVIAHTLIDAVAFLGYPLARTLAPALFA